MLKNLKKLRVEIGISQKELADIVNVSQQSINKYENHNVEPNIETLTLLADYFQTSIDYLVGRSNQPTPSDAADAPCLNTKERMIILKYQRLSPKDMQTIDILIDHLLKDV